MDVKPYTRSDRSVATSRSRLPWLFRGLALGFLCAAAFHAACIVDAALGEPSPPWRHALFIAVNVGVAIGTLWRPGWFLFVFALFAGQQLASHAMDGWRAFSVEQRVDWASLVVVLGVPVVFFALARERERRLWELALALVLMAAVGAGVAVDRLASG